MKATLQSVVGTLVAVATQLFFVPPACAKEVPDVSTILADKSVNVARPLSQAEVSSLGRLSPSDAIAFLKGEAAARIGTDYAKSLIFAAALVEQLNPGTTDSVSGEVEKWLKSRPNASLESKLLTVFTHHGVAAQERLSALRWAIAHYEKLAMARQDPKYPLYERILTRDLSGVGVIDLLKFKEVGFLLDVGDVGVAAGRLRELESQTWPPEFASYVSSLRLRVRLQSSDKPIWKDK
jgi:hypothetical protein